MKKQELKEYIKIKIMSIESSIKWTKERVQEYKENQDYGMFAIYFERQLAEEHHLDDLKQILKKI